MNLTAVLFAVIAAAAPSPHPFAGSWSGDIQVPGAALGVTIHIADDAATATLDIPVQELKRQALEQVVLDVKSGRAAATFQKVGATFDGVISGDSWKGTFLQGPAKLPFALTRTRKDVVAKQRLESIAAAIEAARATASVPGIGVGVVVDGKVIWARGFGQRDLAKKLPVTSQTQFMIGSTTKAFTTATLGTMQDAGTLSLKDRVRQHLPAFDLADDRDDFLTIEDLASHGTGVDRSDLVWYLQPPKSRADVLKTLPLLKLQSAPRATFIYNNWMYAVLGMVIEEKAGKSFNDVVKERLLTPLGMSSTVMDYQSIKRLQEPSLAYTRIDDAIAPVPWHVNPQMVPAGAGTVSNIDDLNRWLAFHLGDGTTPGGKRLLESTTLQQLHTPLRQGLANIADVDQALTSYGYAWSTSAWRGHTRISHGGGIDGFLSLVTFLPTDNIGVVVLQNTTHGDLNDAITDRILEVLLELPTRDALTTTAKKIADGLKKPAAEKTEPPLLARPGTRPAHAMSEYAGTYSSPLFKELVVEVVGDKATVTLVGTKLGLSHAHFETFLISTVDKKDMASFWKAGAITFTTSLDGDVDGIKATIPSMGEVVFTKNGTVPTKAQLQKLVGAYGLDSFVVDVTLLGDTLQLTVAGQPVYSLKHERGLRFTLTNLSGFSAAFVVDGAGAPTGLVMFQPQGNVRLSPVAASAKPAGAAARAPAKR